MGRVKDRRGDRDRGEVLEGVECKGNDKDGCSVGARKGEHRLVCRIRNLLALCLLEALSQ